MFFIHLKPEVEAIGVWGGDRGEISPPLFSLPGGRGGGGSFIMMNFQYNNYQNCEFET